MTSRHGHGHRHVHENPQRTLVKICGIRTPEHATAAVEAGADFIGLVFYPPSHRVVSIVEAQSVVAAIRAADTIGRVRTVGLFVNERADVMHATADAVGLDLLQLSGDEPPELVSTLNRPVLQMLRVDSSGRTDEQRTLERITAAGPNLHAVLVDAHVPGMYGGTGTLADWFVAADLARQTPVMLAGGLTVENVGRAMRSVRPFAVDVSTGVEINKVKDVERIRGFIAAVRAADVELAESYAGGHAVPLAPTTSPAIAITSGKAHR